MIVMYLQAVAKCFGQATARFGWEYGTRIERYRLSVYDWQFNAQAQRRKA